MSGESNVLPFQNIELGGQTLKLEFDFGAAILVKKKFNKPIFGSSWGVDEPEELVYCLWAGLAHHNETFLKGLGDEDAQRDWVAKQLTYGKWRELKEPFQKAMRAVIDPEVAAKIEEVEELQKKRVLTMKVGGDSHFPTLDGAEATPSETQTPEVSEGN
jgi:hypothetical protein